MRHSTGHSLADMSFRANRAGTLPPCHMSSHTHTILDPVCGTCRRKCRKCDRSRPQCQRCVSKGLVCEGYETKFRIYNLASGVEKGPKIGSRARRRQSRNSISEHSTTSIGQARTVQDSPPHTSTSPESKKSCSSGTPDSNSSPITSSLTPDLASSVPFLSKTTGSNDLLAIPETQILLSYCTPLDHVS